MCLSLPSSCSQYIPLIARAAIALIFILSGFQKLMGFDQTAQYIAYMGVPFASLCAVIAIVLELGGGLAILLGYMGGIAAAVLALFTLIITPIFHGDWSGDQGQMQMVMALKNIAIIGGLMMIARHGTGPMSLGNPCGCCEACGHDKACAVK
jgi:putative oxidoreductase